MYIWRGKGRRDRRQFLLSGPSTWGAAKDSANTDLDDECLRIEQEDKHMTFFYNEIRPIMHQYLETPEGLEEIALVSKEFKRIAQAQLEAELAAKAAASGQEREAVDVDRVLPEEAKKRHNVYEVFRRYDADGSDSLDSEELATVLSDLQVPVQPKDLEELLDELDADGNGTIDFEEFYTWFVGSADKQRAKNPFSYAKLLIRKLLFQGIMSMSLYIEARNLLLDEQVARSIASALKEFRIAHPPRFLCDVEGCRKCFLLQKDLLKHRKESDDLHAALQAKERADEERFKVLVPLFKGAIGRKLKAKRVLFNESLGNVEHRVNAAQYAPYRPRLLDIGARREDQQRRHMFVQGFDAKSGVRPRPRMYNMANQHRAPGRQKDQKSFQDMLFDLLYVGDEKVDAVVAPAAAAHASVRFVWKGYASNDIRITGEFNGWRGENLSEVDVSNGKCFLTKQLAAGRYRYRYIVDGQEVVDDTCSTIVDVSEDGEKRVVSNIIQVVNPRSAPPLVQQGLERARKSGNWPNHQRLESGGGDEVVVFDRSAPGGVVSMDGKGEITKRQRSAKEPADGTIVKATDAAYQALSFPVLNLKNLALYDDGAWTLTTFLGRANSSIQEIDLSNNNISDDGMQGFSSVLQHMKALHTLRLNCNGFGFDAARYLSRGIAQCPSLQVLELANNRVGDDGCEPIGVLLKHNTHLKALNLSNCFVGDDGCRELSVAIKQNRALESLKLSHNKVCLNGCRSLCEALKVNGCVNYVDLSENRGIGADGTVYLGDLVETNSSLTFLDLSDIDMLTKHSTHGAHSLCAGLRKNKTLRTLRLCSNKITDIEVIDFAAALMHNRGLTACEMSGNCISDVWFKPETYLTTKGEKNMPTIRTSVDRNVEIHQDPVLHLKYSFRKEVEHDAGVEGQWTLRRKWREVNKALQFKKSAVAESNQELDRILLEEEYVEDKMAVHALATAEMIATPAGAKFVRTVARVFSDCIYELSKRTEDSYDELALIDGKTPKQIAAEKAAKEAEAAAKALRDAEEEANRPKTPAKHIRKPRVRKQVFAKNTAVLDNGTAPPLVSEAQAGGNPAGESTAEDGATADDTILEVSAVYASMSNPEYVLSASLYAIVAAVFRSQRCDEYYRLDPQYLENVFQFLALPLVTLEEAQAAVDRAIIPNSEVIGIRRCCKYVATQAFSICRRNKWERRRILADLYFNPPVEEAKVVVTDYFAAEARRGFVKEYRALPGKAPKYFCDFCNARFPNAKLYERHKVSNKAEHTRFLTAEVVWYSQDALLKRAKYLECGSYFPAYYELNDVKAMPKHYFPQVFDKMGEDGHAIGVIEPNTTLRVEDTLGEYLQIRYDAGLAWVRYKGFVKTIDSPAPRYCTILVPSYRHRPGFWAGMQLWSRPKYYRFNDDLPKNSELKVRLKPDLTEEVVGHVEENMIVEAWGLLDGIWLQIRFNSHDCAWVMCKNAENEVLMLRLHEQVQRRLACNGTLTKRSPFRVLRTDPELAIEKKKKRLVSDDPGSADEGQRPSTGPEVLE